MLIVNLYLKCICKSICVSTKKKKKHFKLNIKPLYICTVRYFKFLFKHLSTYILYIKNKPPKKTKQISKTITVFIFSLFSYPSFVIISFMHFHFHHTFYFRFFLYHHQNNNTKILHI